MLLAQQIVHSLHRIEGSEGNFYKYGIPIAHSTVPQTGKFESFQIFAVL